MDAKQCVQWGPVPSSYKRRRPSPASLNTKLLHIPEQDPHPLHTHTHTTLNTSSHTHTQRTMAITNTNYRQMIQDALESQKSSTTYDDIKTYIFTNYQVKKGFGNWVEHILRQMVAKGEVSKDEDTYILAKYPVSSKKSTLSVCAMRRHQRKWSKRSKSKKRRSRSTRQRRRSSKSRRRRSKSRKSRSRSRARSVKRRRRSRRRRTRSSAGRGKRRSASRARRRGARRVGGPRRKYSKRGKRSGLKRYRKRRSSKRRYRKRGCCFRKAAKVARKKIRYSLKANPETPEKA